MPNTRPFVSAALICEKVLTEEAGVLSAIRIVDVFNIEPKPANWPKEFQRALELVVLVCLKSGDLVGDYKVDLVLRSPDGKTIESSAQTIPVSFRGGEHGANLVVNTKLVTEDLGLYWFDVRWNGDVLTSIPLRLQTTTTQQPGEK